ncbi:hypothetical protein QL285_033623 [Trifolium repens]|nr:hypothetical protein QL285_033623 [Trifolium repens]
MGLGTLLSLIRKPSRFLEYAHGATFKKHSHPWRATIDHADGSFRRLLSRVKDPWIKWEIYRLAHQGTRMKSSCCMESQTEAALLRGQFATKN